MKIEYERQCEMLIENCRKIGKREKTTVQKNYCAQKNIKYILTIY